MRPRLSLLAMILAGVVSAGVGAAWWARAVSRAEPQTTTLEQLGEYGSVPAFTLTERSGRQVGESDLRGSVWVTDFIYTECTETCPTQSLELAALQREFAGTADLRLVSITVDPAHDTPDVLRRYAERYGATDRWWFLTGDKGAIYCLARQGFRLSVVDPSGPAPACGQAFQMGPRAAWASHGSKGLVMHSARLALVDRRGHIRAYHLPTESQSLDRLRVNIRTVLGERGPSLR